MGRKVVYPAKRRIKIKWSRGEIIELLANLDFVVKKIHENSGWAGKEEVLLKLQPRLRKRRTIRQVEEKLKLLNGSAGTNTIEDIYRHGSSRMQSLDVGLQLEVQEELKVVMSEELCVVVSTPRQLRSASRTPGVETSRFKRQSTIVGERKPPRSMRKTRHGEIRDRVSNCSENEPLLSKVRINC